MKCQVFTSGVVNGFRIWTNYHYGYAERDTEATEIYRVNWENLQEFYFKHGMGTPIQIWNFKKGRHMKFFHGYWSTSNKYRWLGLNEWETPLDMVVIISYIAE